MNFTYTGALASAALMTFAFTQIAHAELSEYRVIIQNHTFQPSKIKIPAESKVILVVENSDDSREEFESNSLQQEKIIKPKSRKKIYIGPLSPGEYSFVGEFHPNTARGVIIVE